MKFLLTIENYDPDTEQLEETIAAALDGYPALDDEQPIVVSVEAVPDCVREIERLQQALRIAQQLVGRQTNWMEALYQKLEEAMRIYPKV